MPLNIVFSRNDYDTSWIGKEKVHHWIYMGKWTVVDIHIPSKLLVPVDKSIKFIRLVGFNGGWIVGFGDLTSLIISMWGSGSSIDEALKDAKQTATNTERGRTYNVVEVIDYAGSCLFGDKWGGDKD
jgi:hypothetical protein